MHHSVRVDPAPRRTKPQAIIAAKRAACKWSNARIGLVAGARYIRQKQGIDAIFAFCA
jgi:hypothetical protein